MGRKHRGWQKIIGTGLVLIGIGMIFGILNPLPVYCVGLQVSYLGCLGSSFNPNFWVGFIPAIAGILLLFKGRRR